MTNTKELIERLRGATQKLRKTSMPIADVAPMLSQAADRIEALSAEVERLTNNFKVNLTALHKAANERDQLRAKLEAQGEVVLAASDRLKDGTYPAEWTDFAAKLEAAKPKATHPAPAAPVVKLTEDDWFGIAETCAHMDFNSEKPDGYLNAVKAIGTLTIAALHPT